MTATHCRACTPPAVPRHPGGSNKGKKGMHETLGGGGEGGLNGGWKGARGDAAGASKGGCMCRAGGGKGRGERGGEQRSHI